MTFGYADKLAGALGGEGTEAERAKTQGARDRAGTAAIAGDVLGGVAGMGLGNAAVRGTAALVPGATRIAGAASSMMPQTGLMGLATRSGVMAGQGAAYGALSATGNDTDVAQGAALGGVAGALGNVGGEAISRGIGKVAGAFNKQPKLPTVDELRAAKDAAYSAADDAGVVFTPQAVDRLKETVVAKLAEKAYTPKLQPRVAAVLEELDNLKGQNVTLKGLDTVRQVAGDAFDPMNKKSGYLGRKIIDKIDEVIESPRAGEVLMGNAEAGNAAIKNARALNRSVAKSETIERAMEIAGRNAAGTGSGGNIDNAIRQQIKIILNSPSRSRGFSKDELAAMEDVVRGTPSRNAARLVGKLAPSGNGLMAALQLGAAGATSGASVPVAGVGMVAKKLAEVGTQGGVDDLTRIIAAGGKRSDAFAAPNAVQRLTESKRDALIRALLAGSLPALTNAQ
jgi:hypothetical protein